MTGFILSVSVIVFAIVCFALLIMADNEEPDRAKHTLREQMERERERQRSRQRQRRERWQEETRHQLRQTRKGDR